jgi:hypothetical protein
MPQALFILLTKKRGLFKKRPQIIKTKCIDADDEISARYKK